MGSNDNDGYGKVKSSANGETGLVPTSEAGEIVKGGGTLVRTQVEYQTAITVQVKREFKQIIDACVGEAKIAGARFYYAWEAKGKGGTSQIEGESIEMAMCLARNWGNCATPVELVETTAEHFVFRAHFVDLETGFNTSRIFMQRRDQRVYGKFQDDARPEMIRFQIGQSKAIRNVILKALPPWLKDEVLHQAKNSAMADITTDNLPQKRKDAVTALGSFGVKQVEIEGYFGKALPQWTADDILALRGFYQRIKQGEAEVKEIFGTDEPPKDDKPDARSMIEDAKDKPDEAKDTEPKDDTGQGGSNQPPPTDEGAKGEAKNIDFPEEPPVDDPPTEPAVDEPSEDQKALAADVEKVYAAYDALPGRTMKMATIMAKQKLVPNAKLETLPVDKLRGLLNYIDELSKKPRKGKEDE